MPNLYKNWKPEQRNNWNKYNNNYSKTHFKSVNIKLRYDEDKDIIDYLQKHKSKTVSVSELLRTIIREHISKK